MIEMKLDVDMNDIGGVGGVDMPLLEVGPLDDLYYRYVSNEATGPTAGKLTAFTQRTTNEPPYQGTDLTLDGDEQTLAIDGVNYLSFSVTTAESGKTGTLYIFARKTQE